MYKVHFRQQNIYGEHCINAQNKVELIIKNARIERQMILMNIKDGNE